jgi:predicted O-methyltransferase YrrM
MAMVAAMRPEAQLVGFDLWISNYSGMENPGPQFVQQELERVGYRGKAEFISGNSRQTIPEYFRAHPDAYFDVITVDGDHSLRGATTDLKNVIPRLKVGGVLVFDDIVNLWHLHMEKVWRKAAEKGKRFTTYRFDEVGYGIALGIKQY